MQDSHVLEDRCAVVGNDYFSVPGLDLFWQGRQHDRKKSMVRAL
jgi:hypothetical protein